MNADQFALSDYDRPGTTGRAASCSTLGGTNLDQHEMERILEEFCFLSDDPIRSLSEVAQEMRGLKHAVWSLVLLLVVIGLVAFQLA